MSALTKIGGVGAKGDLRGGGTVSALHRRQVGGIVPGHPPLAKRLARLARMAREQGKPVGT